MKEKETRERSKLLIVEDNDTIRLYLRVLLSSEYDLVMAEDGQQGVDMTLSEMPDLVICDILMPVKNGFEYCRDIRRDPRTSHIPVIIVSAKTEDDDIIRGTELGADDYLTKPFNPNVLKAKISNLIRSRSHLKTAYLKELSAPEGEPVLTAEAEFMQKAGQLIRDHMHDPSFGVHKLAELLDVSQPTLYRKVKQATGRSIVKLIRDIRLEQATVLLSQLRYTVQEVAEMVGYNDLPTFRKHFVSLFAVTPSSYVAYAKSRATNS